MTSLFVILIALVSLLLMLVVLVQSPKSSGMGGALGGSGSNMLGGVKRTSDFLERSTWVLAFTLFALVLLVNMFNRSDSQSGTRTTGSAYGSSGVRRIVITDNVANALTDCRDIGQLTGL